MAELGVVPGEEPRQKARAILDRAGPLGKARSVLDLTYCCFVAKKPSHTVIGLKPPVSMYAGPVQPAMVKSPMDRVMGTVFADLRCNQSS